MTDKEKVIKGLECAIGIRGCKDCGNCPYDYDFNCLGCDIVMRNALALLKEQKWIPCSDRMPPELHSIWFTLYGTQKWRDAMWREESDKVIVAVAFPDGTRYVTTGETQDGKWKTTISQTIPYTVTHWMSLPEPPEEVKQDGRNK